MRQPPTLGDILLAEGRIRPHLPPTPLEAAPALGENVWLKLENANKTHSFKIRGAMNAMLKLDREQRAKGIIAASSGNHAAAVAYAAQMTGAAAKILMPKGTPKKKIANVRRYGAEAIIYGDNYDQTEAEALRRAESAGIWLSPYNDADVIAGAGPIGLEIAGQLPSVERVLVPVSGGGLIAGVATALKAIAPAIEVIGVNAESAPAMFNALKGNDKPQNWDTLAEALSGDIEAGAITLPVCREFVDDIVLVSEAHIADAMRFLLEAGWVVEGGGAVAVAALMSGAVTDDGRQTVALVSGGNVDLATLRRVLSAS